MPTTTMTTTARAIRRLRIITGIDYILGHPARSRNEGGLDANLHRPRQLHRSGDPEHQGRPQAPRRRQEDAEGHGRRAEAVLSDDGRPRHRHGHGGPERRDGREVHPHALRGRQRPHDDDEGVHRGGVPEADLDASVTLPEYRVKARNTAESPENKIHDDAVARQYGFRGGLVPGVTVYAYLTHPLVAAFGAAWLERGTADVRFVEPVLDGEELTVAGTVVGRDAKGVTATLVASTAAAGECATLTATLPAGSPVPVNLALYPMAPLPAERPAATRPHLDGLAALGTPVTTYDDARAGEYLEKVGDALGLYPGCRRPSAASSHATRSATQDLSGQRSGVLAAVHDGDAVDDHRHDPDRILVRLIERGPLGDGLRVEHCDVRPVPRPEEAPGDETDGRRRPARHFMDRLGQRQQSQLAHVLPQDPRERAIAARMRLALAGHPVRRDGIPIRADQDHRRAEQLSDVLLRHRGDEDPGRATVGDQEVTHGIDPIERPAAGDVAEGAALAFRPMGRDGDADRVPRWNPSPAPEPVGGDVLPRTGSHVRPAETGEHGVHAALLNPRRQEVAERVAGGRIRILITVDRHPALPRRLDLGEQARGAAPAVRSRKLQVDDLDVNPARFSDRDRLAHGLEHASGLVADMRRVRGSVPAQDVRQTHHLLGPGEAPRRGEQARRETERARRQRLLEHPPHH